MDTAQELRDETRTVWATAICLAIGTVAGLVVLRGPSRPMTGASSLSQPIAVIAALSAAIAFVVSTLQHRRGETVPMPRWQTVASDSSAVALTVAFAAVSAFGVLLAGVVFGAGMHDFAAPTLGGGLIAGVAAATGGRFAYTAGVGIRTRDLADLLFGYLLIGTLFAMSTATEPLWWQQNFSQLGLGSRGWTFNGTVIVAGLLFATVGSYIGRDLHRVRGDTALRRIAAVVALWAAMGIALAVVGFVPIERNAQIHGTAAISALVLFGIAAVVSTSAMPGPPRAIMIATIGMGILLVFAVLLDVPIGLYPLAGLEAISVGLGLVWMTTYVRVLAVLGTDVSKVSERATLRDF